LAVYWGRLKKTIRDPLAFRPTLADGLAFSDCFYVTVGIMTCQEQNIGSAKPTDYTGILLLPRMPGTSTMSEEANYCYGKRMKTQMEQREEHEILHFCVQLRNDGRVH